MGVTCPKPTVSLDTLLWQRPGKSPELGEERKLPRETGVGGGGGVCHSPSNAYHTIGTFNALEAYIICFKSYT